MTHAESGPVGTGLRADALLAGVRGSPFAVGASITALLLVGFALLMGWSGGVDEVLSSEQGIWEHRDFRIALLVSLLAGYLPTARYFEARSAARSRRDLQPVLRPGADAPEAFCRLSPRMAGLAGLMGTAIVPSTALFIDRDPSLYFAAGYWRPEAIFGWTVGGFVGFWLGSFVYVTLAYARRFSRLAESLEEPDLLDLEPVRPFARHGLSSALLWLVLVSLVTVNAVDLAWFGLMVSIAFAGGIVALVVPVQGLRVRIRDTKRAELARVNATIRGDASAIGESSVGGMLAGGGAPLSLGDLLAYRSHVESVREWPFDTFTIVRFALYLVIPLGSWLGGAFVERLLGAALD